MLLHATDSRHDLMFLSVGVESQLLPSLLSMPTFGIVAVIPCHHVMEVCNFLPDIEGDCVQDILHLSF